MQGPKCYGRQNDYNSSVYQSFSPLNEYIKVKKSLAQNAPACFDDMSQKIKTIHWWDNEKLLFQLKHEENYNCFVDEKRTNVVSNDKDWLLEFYFLWIENFLMKDDAGLGLNIN